MDIIRDDIFQQDVGVHAFWHRRNIQILKEVKVEPVEEK